MRPIMLRVPSIVACALLATAAPAAPPRPSAIVLKAARLFDGKSDRLGTPGVVVVEGDKIVGVGSGASVPEGARVIDLGDATLSPGFIDAHTHVTGQSTDDFNRNVVTRLRREVPEQTLYAASYAKATVEAGFTTIRNLGAGDFIDVGLRNAIGAGLVPGPRMLVSGHALGARGGHSDRSGFRHDAFDEADEAKGIASGPSGFREAVRYQVKFGADVIKFSASGGVLSVADEVDTPQLTFEEMRALVDEAHRLRKKVAAHCHGDAAAKEAIRAGVDSIEHGSFLSAETLTMMKEQGTYLVPTLMAPDYLKDRLDKFPPEIAAKGRAAIAAVSTMFRDALRIGVKIGLGTDAGVYPHGGNAREFRLMADLGMPPIEALRAGTSANAELLGISAKAGTLEPGKVADVVAIPGDPTADITATERVTFVMAAGRVIRGGDGSPR